MPPHLDATTAAEPRLVSTTTQEADDRRWWILGVLALTGALLSIVTLGALLFGIIEGQERGWTDPVTVGSFALAAIGLAGIVAWERRCEFPMLAVVTAAAIVFVRGLLPGRERGAVPVPRSGPIDAVDARGLVKRFGATTALDGIDIRVPTGSVTAVLGPNGAGKTTAVRILATLTDADEGEATVAGYDVRSQPTEVRRRIGLTAQDATVDPLLTGRENLVMLGELHQLSRGEAAARATQLLDDLSLTDAADRVVSGYSGGMRRRLDLAATLVGRPEVLFLDEPTTGLDPRGRNELWSVLDSLVDRGTTVILTTQYLEEAERLADDIVVIDHGHVIARGDAATLKRQVGGNHLHLALADGQDVERATRILGNVVGAEPSVDTATRTVTAPTTRGVEALTSVASALTSAGIAVDDLSLRQPTLDEVFLTLTGSPPRSDGDGFADRLTEVATA